MKSRHSLNHVKRVTNGLGYLALAGESVVIDVGISLIMTPLDYLTDRVEFKTVPRNIRTQEVIPPWYSNGFCFKECVSDSISNDLANTRYYFRRGLRLISNSD